MSETKPGQRTSAEFSRRVSDASSRIQFPEIQKLNHDALYAPTPLYKMRSAEIVDYVKPSQPSAAFVEIVDEIFDMADGYGGYKEFRVPEFGPRKSASNGISRRWWGVYHEYKDSHLITDNGSLFRDAVAPDGNAHGYSIVIERHSSLWDQQAFDSRDRVVRLASGSMDDRKTQAVWIARERWRGNEDWYFVMSRKGTNLPQTLHPPDQDDETDRLWALHFENVAFETMLSSVVHYKALRVYLGKLSVMAEQVAGDAEKLIELFKASSDLDSRV